mgnify:CR=1 FL=1
MHTLQGLAASLPVTLTWGILIPAGLGVLPYLVPRFPLGQLLKLAAPALLLAALAALLRYVQPPRRRLAPAHTHTEAEVSSVRVLAAVAAANAAGRSKAAQKPARPSR